MEIKKTLKEANIQKAINSRKLRAETIDGYKKLLSQILLVALVGVIIFTQIFIVARARGIGMFPSINDGDVAIAYRFAYGFKKDYQKDDVILFEMEKEDTDGKKYKEICFGRVVARGGDVVLINDNGQLFINGTNQDGEIIFRTDKKEGIEYPYTVPEDSFFVLGDYRTKSLDSRDYGPIHKDKVKGKIVTIFRIREI